ncbi:MAG: threonylcarbamoyl-AMP synthase [Dehalococcoidia bacterium]|nr:MAG: threonylcarbamoyl-AMP synthase [Dehalococcoidia bacterium]
MSTSPSINQQIERAIEILKNGGIVAFPTDTVYGLGGNPFIQETVERIYRVKRRAHSLPLPLLLAEQSDIVKIAAEIPDSASCLAEHFFPGGLTLVLKSSAWVPNTIRASGDTVAIRIPDHHVPIALIHGLGLPLVGTSANVSGNPSPVTAEEVSDQLGGLIDMVIDGGRCPNRLESTVIDTSIDPPAIIREGAVSQQEISSACGYILRKA